MAPPEVRDGWRRGVFIGAAVVLILVFVLVKHLNGNLVAQ